MNIYILEDDLMQQTRISDIIRELVSEGTFSVRKLEVFSKPHKLLSSINEKGNHQVFLLDIDIDGERKKGLEEFAPISFKYKVSALDFIDKTVSNAEFKQQLKQTLTFVNQKVGDVDDDEIFVFETAQSRIQVPMRDIYYFATAVTPHKVMLITKTERLEFYANLGDITSVNKKLFSCHRSFLVNLDNISRIDKSQLMIYFENGDSCPVSRLKMKALLKKWSDVKEH